MVSTKKSHPIRSSPSPKIFENSHLVGCHQGHRQRDLLTLESTVAKRPAASSAFWRGCWVDVGDEKDVPIVPQTNPWYIYIPTFTKRNQAKVDIYIYKYTIHGQYMGT